MDNIKTFSLYHRIFHKKHGCNVFPYVRFIFYLFEKKNLHKSSTLKKKHWVREIYLTRQNDNEDLKTSTHMMQHDKGANKHPYSRPSTPPTFTNSRTRCDESFFIETISFMRFEVAKANTSRNQRKSCSKENIVCCFLVLLNWFYYNDSSVNAIVFPFQRVNLSTFFFQGAFLFSSMKYIFYISEFRL